MKGLAVNMLQRVTPKNEGSSMLWVRARIDEGIVGRQW